MTSNILPFFTLTNSQYIWALKNHLPQDGFTEFQTEVRRVILSLGYLGI
ncbi:MAG: hypothetical protein FD133_651 [Erysipelotrichaceae bacterium]|nr:MAG: hypothetical protein FD133_651 [Erysipelotrichaceae bacterium]